MCGDIIKIVTVQIKKWSGIDLIQVLFHKIIILATLILQFKLSYFKNT